MSPSPYLEMFGSVFHGRRQGNWTIRSRPGAPPTLFLAHHFSSTTKTSVRCSPSGVFPSWSSQSDVNMKKRPSCETFPRGVDQKPFLAVLYVWANRQTLEAFPSISAQSISFSHGPVTRGAAPGVFGFVTW